MLEPLCSYCLAFLILRLALLPVRPAVIRSCLILATRGPTELSDSQNHRIVGCTSFAVLGLLLLGRLHCQVLKAVGEAGSVLVLETAGFLGPFDCGA